MAEREVAAEVRAWLSSDGGVDAQAEFVAMGDEWLHALMGRVEQAERDHAEAMAELQVLRDEVVALKEDRDRLKAENAAWCDRFRAIVGEKHPGSAGNAVLTLKAENKRLASEASIARAERASIKAEALRIVAHHEQDIEAAFRAGVAVALASPWPMSADGPWERFKASKANQPSERPGVCCDENTFVAGYRAGYDQGLSQDATGQFVRQYEPDEALARFKASRKGGSE